MTKPIVLVLLAALVVVSSGHRKSLYGDVSATGPSASQKHYETLFQGGATPQQKVFVDWMLKYKYFDSGAVQERPFGVRGKGMVFNHDIKKGQELFAIPVELMIYTSNPHLSPRTKRILELFRERMRQPGYHPEDFELTEMALIVMFEKRDPDSFFAPYLALLQEPLCPAFYDEEEMNAFEFDWIKPWASYFMSDAVQNFQLLMQQPEFELTRSREMADEFKWAVSTVNQRSLDSGPDSRREYVMVPYLDMINHGPNITNNYYYSRGPFRLVKADGHVEQVPIPRSMVLAADTDYKAGDTAQISYSSKSNSVQLLLQYGFLVPDNENDYLLLHIEKSKNSEGIFASIRRYGGIPHAFVKAVDQLIGGKGEVSLAAYETIRNTLQSDLDSFMTTLEHDQKLLQSDDHSRSSFSIVSYRVEAKKFLRDVLARVQQAINQLKQNQVPRDGENHTKRDWPLRYLVFRPPEDKAARAPKTEL